MTKKWSPLPLDDHWVITDIGLEQYERIVISVDKAIDSGRFDSTEEDDKQGSDLLTVQGSIGIVSIKGPLVNNDSIWNRLFGITSYNEVQRALLEAVENVNIDRIVLDVDSPGGSVGGVGATADLIYAIDQTVKPVFAATDGTMASGAYWLASSARELYGAELSTIGSIGVVTTHMEQTKRLEKEGIKATVIRSGRYKQLGNPNEPLTEEGYNEIKGHLDKIYRVFVNHVAEVRNKSYEYTDEFMAQGREFMGDTAKEVGLIDNVANFQSAIAEISAKSIDTSRFPYKIMV